MKILFLTQILPYPPDAGPKVKTWHVIRYLAEHGNQIYLATFVRPEEIQHIPQLESICTQVHTVPIKRSRVADVGYLIRSFFTRRPFLIERDDLGSMRETVTRILTQEQIDVIHADQLTMTQFCLPRAFPQNKRERMNSNMQSLQPIRVFDAHNAVWMIVARMEENASWFLKPLARLEAARVKHYEGAVVAAYEHTLAVSQIDAEALTQAYQEINDKPDEAPSIHVVPIVIDTSSISPLPRRQQGYSILTLGSLHYPPNADGIRWFLNQVFPLVISQLPAAQLTIIGKNPPADFLQLAEQQPDNITVTGYVPDLKPYISSADIMVIPVNAGGGMRVRILEAFAYGIPVVTTTIGLEGIQATPGESVLIADTPGEFAKSVVQLLNSPELQDQLSTNARRLVERQYDWQAALGKIPLLYQSYDTPPA